MWSKTQQNAIHILALTFACLSFLSACIVIFFVFRRKTHKGILQRFPIYVCGLEIAFNIFHSFDHAYAIAHGELPPDGLCRAVGAGIEFFIGGQVILNGLIALTVYMTVCHKKLLVWGRYDWKLLVLVVGIPTVIIIFGLSFELFGADKLWCYIRSDSGFTREAFLIFGVIPVTSGIFLTSFFYVCAIRKILQMPKDPKNLDAGITQRMLATKKTTTFILVFMLQWIFPWFYGITIVSKSDTFVIRLLVTFMNTGGVLNLGALIYNHISEERLRKVVEASNTNMTRSNDSGNLGVEINDENL